MVYCLHPKCGTLVEGGYCAAHGGLAQRPSPARRGYTRQWRAYAQAFLARPEHRYCVCGCGRRADTVDHIVAVQGSDDPLFWDPQNHQAMYGDCHRAKTNRHDGGFGNPRRALEPTAIAEQQVMLIAGPPCSGKSTYARQLGVPVLDWDELYAQHTGLALHARTGLGVDEQAVERRFREELARMRAGALVVIRGAPERWQRGMYRRQYYATVLVLEVPMVECVRRLHASQRPRAEWLATERAIRGWWRRYERSPQDRVLGPAGAAA